jgi:DNA polymerase III subunit beta
MKFTASQSSLLSALIPVSAVVPSKSPMPALAHIQAVLKGNSLSFAATDLEVSMENKLQVTGQEDGKSLIPARKFMDLLRELPDEQLTIQITKSDRITVMDQGGKKYNFSGESEEMYPKIPVLDESKLFKIDRSRLRRMISKTLFAVSRDELRPQLTGVFLQLGPGMLRLVSTDGHRLVKVEWDNAKYEGEAKDFIVPAKAMVNVQRIAEGEGDIEIAFASNQLGFRVGNTTLVTKLIDGRFPNYTAVIPTENKNTLKIDLDQLGAAVRRVQIFSNAISRQIRVKLETEKATVTAEDVEEGGEAQETVVCSYNGESMEIGYNSGYVLDMLKQIDTSEVLFELGSATSAGIVKPTEQEDNEDLLMLIMPVRLN